jgi:hypothetical protein
MSKKKSKKRKKLAREQDGHTEMGALGTRVKNVGTTVAGVLIGEVVEAAVEELLKRFPNASGSNNTHPQNVSHKNGDRLHSTVSKLQDSIEDAELDAPDVVDTIKASAAHIQPGLIDTIEKLKDATQQPAEAVKATTQTTVADAVNVAKSVIDAVSSENLTQSNQKHHKKSKRSKKGKKKQKKS